MENRFYNANEAFEHYVHELYYNSISYRDTRAMFNVGFLIENPLDNHITTDYRKWDLEYAEAEWQWYCQGIPNITSLGQIYGKVPKIWLNIADQNGRVNSNYGYHIFKSTDSEGNYGSQYGRVIRMLQKDPSTRQACMSIYNGRANHKYKNDVPCTYAINFYILDNKLNMSVMMRSNDIWYGFCNDQYCFSELLRRACSDVSDALNREIQVGTYYHFVNNLHLYEKNVLSIPHTR